MSDQNDLSQHILPTSAQLVGVCLTVISLVKVLHLGQAGSLLDRFLAIDALLFTISTALSYASMRGEKSANLEKYADQFFMLGLLELGGCAVLLAFEII
jgi:Mn2+/Fe2+ NRAMP family transporter